MGLGGVPPSPMGTNRALPALAAVLWASSASAQVSTSYSKPVYTDMVSRVIAAHQRDAAWASGIKLERQIFAIPGGAPGSTGLLTPTLAPSPRGAGLVIDVPMRHVIPWSAAAKAASRALPLIGTALVIKDLFDAVRCREAFGGSGECDVGQPETPQATFCVQRVGWAASGNTICAPSVAAAHEANTRPTPWVVAEAPGHVGSTRFETRTQNCSLFACDYQQRSVSLYPTAPHFSSTGAWSLFGRLTAGQGPVTLICPEVTGPSGLMVPVKGGDNLCPTMVYVPRTIPQIGDIIENRTDIRDGAKPWVIPMIRGDIEFDAGAPTFEPPASVTGPRETTTRPDGSASVKDTSWDLIRTPGGWDVVPRVIVREYAPGVPIPAPGLGPPGTETVGGAPTNPQAPGAAPAPIELKTCGLPGTPPCKIDEAGTPGPVPALAPPVVDALTDIFSAPPAASTAWSWAFAFPSSCSPLTVGSFAGRVLVLDMCAHQPMIHAIMTFAWLLGTLFLGIGMVGRTLSTG